jgi:Virulence factor BrkB
MPGPCGCLASIGGRATHLLALSISSSSAGGANQSPLPGDVRHAPGRIRNLRHRQPALRWVTPGSAIALVTWILASGAFGICVSQFGSYNKTYGTLGGVIVFLTWLWVSNVALLFGLEFDAELERSRELAAGDRRALEEVQLEPRAQPKPA